MLRIGLVLSVITCGNNVQQKNYWTRRQERVKLVDYRRSRTDLTGRGRQWWPPNSHAHELAQERIARLGNTGGQSSMPTEPFVSAEEAASFLAIKRRYLLALARNGIAGAYALGTGTVRKVWVFRLSELSAAIAGKNSDPKMRELCDPASGSPR
jgi:hypothetical protein